MAKKKSHSLRCPTCRTLVLKDRQNYPFCSERCRLLDLGKWDSGGYVISTPIADHEMLENLVDEQKPRETDDGDSLRKQ